MIRKAEIKDYPAAAALAARMWDHEPEELIQGFAEADTAGEGAVFIAEEDGRAVGFAQCGLRHDYVEGTETSPVGYLEGVYVDEACRRRGYAARLLAACESWAKEKGCREFASDCELTNTGSLQFHLSLGFQEANRIICFTKEL
ncbi:MAG: GNAT family N-acetyltransferase [Clostridia bacterium]|nr:GNAT family N-acetyltransferase [Clostridia bacterium]